MATTRKRNDPYEQKIYVNSSAEVGKYYLNVPGPGINLPFFEDPHIRIQKWGANMMTNTIGVENDLLGKTRPINSGFLDTTTYQETAAITKTVQYPVMQSYVEQSRASHPAWMYRDLEQTNWSFPILNPQYAPGNYMPGTFGLGRGMHENISTRILEQNNYKPDY
jgi:hypothetical protein